MVFVNRNELKFFLSKVDYAFLRRVFRGSMRPDFYSQKGSYYIRSLYFDTIENRAFTEKMDGLANRKKYRLRIYDLDSDKVKFEIKNKLKNKTYKETGVITRSDAQKVIQGNVDILLNYNNPVLNKIYLEFKKAKFVPAVLVDYQREAFICNFNNIRITFDSKLSSSSRKDLFKKTHNLNVFDDVIILEVKYNNFLPQWIKLLLSSINSPQSAISKFCLSRLQGYV